MRKSLSLKSSPIGAQYISGSRPYFELTGSRSPALCDFLSQYGSNPARNEEFPVQFTCIARCCHSFGLIGTFITFMCCLKSSPKYCITKENPPIIILSTTWGAYRWPGFAIFSNITLKWRRRYHFDVHSWITCSGSGLWVFQILCYSAFPRCHFHCNFMLRKVGHLLNGSVKQFPVKSMGRFVIESDEA